MFLNYGNSPSNTPHGYMDKTITLEISSCGIYQLSASDKILETCRPKGRSDYQLLYIASGKGYFFASPEALPKVLQAGTMFLYHPYEFQKYECHGEDNTCIYWIHFTGNGIAELFQKYYLDEEKHIFTSGTESFYALAFDQIILELQLRKEFYRESTALLLSHIIMIVGRYNIEASHSKQLLPDNINDAINFISEHFQENIVIEDYIKRLNCSASTFFRNFKNYTGMTPLQFLLQKRMNYAKKLLETTNLPVSEITAKVGYENPLYFSRLFHKHTKLSPSRYRQKFSDAARERKNHAVHQSL